MSLQINNTNFYTLCCVVIVIIYFICAYGKIVENFDTLNTEAINMIASIYNDKNLITDSVTAKSINVDRS